jgi:hypothetical protein
MAVMNRMSAANLAMIFSPNLLRTEKEELSQIMMEAGYLTSVVKLMIEEIDYMTNVRPRQHISGIATVAYSLPLPENRPTGDSQDVGGLTDCHAQGGPGNVTLPLLDLYTYLWSICGVSIHIYSSLHMSITRRHVSIHTRDTDLQDLSSQSSGNGVDVRSSSSLLALA